MQSSSSELRSQKSGKHLKNKSLKNVEGVIPVIAPALAAWTPPIQGSIAYSQSDNNLYVGNGKTWKQVCDSGSNMGHDNCNPTPYLYQVFVNPNMQPAWQIGDYDVVNGVPNQQATPVALMNYMYQSDMAINGDIYKLSAPQQQWPDSYKGYEIHDTNLEFFTTSTSNPIKTPSNLKPLSGVPGPFDYNMDFSKWGGDDTLGIGKSFYSNILGHFGHTHILSVHGKISAKLNNPAADTSFEDNMMTHLLNGSTEIFRWYAQLVDSNGKSIAYTTAAGMIPMMKGFMDMFITGAGTPLPVNGSLQSMDPNQVIGMFQYIKGALSGDTIIGPVAASIVDNTIPYLQDLLRIGPGQSNPIAFSSWFYLMQNHQMLVHMIYDVCRPLYTMDPMNPMGQNYNEMLAMANSTIYSALDTGRQMAAFFGVFYAATSLLDLLVTYVTGDKINTAIPLNNVVERVDFIQQAQKRWWYEHVTMFSDFDRAGAAGDQFSMYKIELTMLESCAFIACTVGEVFRAFDTLVRNRNLYTILSQMPAPVQTIKYMDIQKLQYEKGFESPKASYTEGFQPKTKPFDNYPFGK